MRRPGGFIGAAALLCSSIAVAVAVAAAAEPEPQVVEINKFSFMPREITIAAGTQVTWLNRDATIHSIVSEDKLFSSRGLDTGDRFSATFDHAGDFSYVCSLHPFMTGIVHVRESKPKPP
jgi:plastocyanin